MIEDASFILPGGQAGVLLIHGLTGTPNEMRIIAKGLNKAGFTVMAMQLAGHCGTEEDLCKTCWQDWYASVAEAAENQWKQGHVKLRLCILAAKRQTLKAIALLNDQVDDVWS